MPADDVRANQPWVDCFSGGRPDPAWLARVDAIREVLAGGGRTLAQGALCWLLARSPRTVPIPGTTTVAQAEQNAAPNHPSRPDRGYWLGSCRGGIQSRLSPLRGELAARAARGTRSM